MASLHSRTEAKGGALVNPRSRCDLRERVGALAIEKLVHDDQSFRHRAGIERRQDNTVTQANA